jgi:hypothetical protein
MVGSPEQKGVRRAIGYEEPLNVSRPNRAVGKTSDHYIGAKDAQEPYPVVFPQRW